MSKENEENSKISQIFLSPHKIKKEEEKKEIKKSKEI